MPVFNIGHRKISLKDAFCKSDDRFRRTFAAQNQGTLTPVTVDDLQIAEDHLDVDLVGDLVNLERYVKIGYREKTGALSGDRLGAISEALTWLEFKRQGRRIVRVIGVEPPSLPRPDFITREGSKKIRLVEVKSTDAYSASMLAMGKKDKRPCEATRESARDALLQLGVDSTELVQIDKNQVNKNQVNKNVKYDLKARDSRKSIPFPGDAATAVVWLVRDQRLDGRGIGTVVAEKSCIEEGRICAKCVGTGPDALHLMMVTMPNNPDFVPTWPSNHRSDEWFNAYERWIHADWLRHPDALEETANALWELTTSWMESTGQKWHERQNESDFQATSYHWWRRQLTTRFMSSGGGFPRDATWFDRSTARELPGGHLALRRDRPSFVAPETDADPVQFGEDGSSDWRWSLRTTTLSWDLRLQGPRPVSKVRGAFEIAWRALRLLIGESAWTQRGDFPGFREIRYGKTLLGWTAQITRAAWTGEPGLGVVWDRPVSALLTSGRRLRITVHPDGRARIVMEGDG